MIMGLTITSCIRSKNNFGNPQDLIEHYLLCNSWQDRLEYVLDSSNVKPLMEKYYEKTDFSEPMQIKNIKVVPNNIKAPLPDSIIAMSATMVYKNALGTEVHNETTYYVIKTKNGFKIDWPSSVGYNLISLDVYKASKPPDVVTFRVICSLSDYYNYGYRNSREQYYSIECTTDLSHLSIYCYVLKNSDEGRKLFDILKDGYAHRMTLAVKFDYHSDGNSEITTLCKIIAVGWYVSKSSVIVSSNNITESSDFLVNSLTGHVYLSDDIIYSLYFIEKNEVVVSIFNFGDFQQPYTITDSIIDIKLWKTPLQYKILNGHQLRLIKAPHSFSKNNVMEFRK